jgi:hypothetical protein
VLVRESWLAIRFTAVLHGQQIEATERRIGFVKDAVVAHLQAVFASPSQAVMRKALKSLAPAIDFALNGLLNVRR